MQPYIFVVVWTDQFGHTPLDLTCQLDELVLLRGQYMRQPTTLVDTIEPAASEEAKHDTTDTVVSAELTELHHGHTHHFTITSQSASIPVRARHLILAVFLLPLVIRRPGSLVCLSLVDEGKVAP